MRALNPAAEFLYNEAVLALFYNLRHVGSLPVGADIHVVQVGTAAQGVSASWYVQTATDRIITVRYRAYGCPHFLAACESLARWLEGRERAALSDWQWRDLEIQLGVPAAKRSRLLLLDDVVRQLQLG